MEGDALKALLLCLLPFVLLCTLNSATYRYGASDQAFYIPAVVLNLHPEAFPRDAPLIRAQAELTLVDETVGGISRLTGLSLPVLFAAMYVGSLVLLAAAAWLIAVRLYRTTWGPIALLAALTLRHSISRTGTNTLEGYFHPRQLAFALGAMAVAFVLRRQVAIAVLALVAAAAVHPTTAMWFGLWIAVALAVLDRRWRVLVGGGAVLGAAIAGWAVTVGPLAGRLAVMDPAWLATLDEKVYLFPVDWPVAAWVTNLISIPIIVAIYRWRRATAGLVDPAETAIVSGVLSLAMVFAVLLPFNAMHVAIAVQLQPARLFWMLDFFATIYLMWAVAEGPAPTLTRARLVTAAVIALAALRGGYVKLFEFPDRPVARLDIADDDWGRAMAWARGTDIHSGWLADPIHAARFGTSVRVAAERDVFVEAIKDTAIGMYDRPTAVRTRDRRAALGDFAALTADHARALAAEYDLDYLVVDRTFDLPLAFESGSMRIYRLR